MVLITSRSRALVYACLLCAGGVPAAAAEGIPASADVRRLTLDEAKQLALSNNKVLNLARLSVAEKGHATAAARKDYLPKLVGIDSYYHFNDDLGSVVTVQRGIRGILPPGSRTISANVFNQDSNLASLMVAQPITKLIAVSAAVQAANADQAVAQAQFDKDTRDILSGVAQAYYGLLGAQRIQSALELQATMLEQAFRAKPSPELRVALIELRKGLAQTRGQVRELTQQLDDVLDLPPCTVLELIDPVPAAIAVHCASEAADLAVTCSPEVREAEQGIAKAEAAMKIARMACLPDISIIGGYANQSGASYIQPNFGFLGLTGSYTFFEWGKRRDIKCQREMDMAIARQNLQVTMDKVRMDARKAYDRYDQAREEYQLAGEMVQARKEAEKALGPAAAQAKSDTAKAELDFMKAEIGYRVAHAQLTGLLNGH
jgi:outer membrane protein TolC